MVCTKCGWPILIPSGCACTREAKRKRDLQEAERKANELAASITPEMIADIKKAIERDGSPFTNTILGEVDDMVSEFKQCPCGSVRIAIRDNPDNDTIRISCPTCGRSTAEFKDRLQAITAWNEDRTTKEAK